MRVRLIILVSFTVFWASGASGQFWDRLTNPTVNVTLTHPPGLGLNVKSFAFAAGRGDPECTENFIDAVISDFTAAGADVVDRQNLETILSEHQLNLSEFVDSSKAAEFGKLLGPAAVVILRVQRCKPEVKRTYEDFTYGKTRHRRHIATTSVNFKGYVRAIDLRTGKILSEKPFDQHHSMFEATVDDCCPDFPSTDQVIDGAQQLAVGQVHRLFFPWSEQRDLYFFDDGQCGLDKAYRLLRAGDQQGALQLSITNAEMCATAADVKPKVVWHSLYNVGMAQFILGDYEKALDHLTKAAAAGGGNIVTDSIGECRRAQQLAIELARVDQKPVLDVGPPQQTASKSASGSTAGRTAASSDGSSSNVEDRLKKLKGLYEKGVITKSEYEKKRADILKDM
jgi:hypothetical protein